MGCLSSNDHIEPLDNDEHLKSHIDNIELTWNQNMSASYTENLEFVTDRRVRSKRFYKWDTILSEQKITPSMGDIFEWQITTKTYGNYFYIGFIVTDIGSNEFDSMYNDGKALGQNTTGKDFGVYIDHNETRFIIWHNNHTRWITSQKTKFKWKSGDRFKIKIDFKANRALLYYNGEYAGNIFSINDKMNENTVIIPAVTLYNVDDVLIKTIKPNEPEPEEEQYLMGEAVIDKQEQKKAYNEGIQPVIQAAIPALAHAIAVERNNNQTNVMQNNNSYAHGYYAPGAYPSTLYS